MLRKIRTTLAILFCFAVALLFLDFSGSIHAWLGWMAKVQFFPAVLALNFIVVAALLLLTFVFGRVYCSVICPLGVFQDAVSWLRGRMRKKDRFRFRFRKEHRLLRYGVLLAFVLRLPDFAAMPKAVGFDHIEENFAVKNIVLTEEDVEQLSAFFPAPNEKIPMEKY